MATEAPSGLVHCRAVVEGELFAWNYVSKGKEVQRSFQEPNIWLTRVIDRVVQRRSTGDLCQVEVVPYLQGPGVQVAKTVLTDRAEALGPSRMTASGRRWSRRRLMTGGEEARGSSIRRNLQAAHPNRIVIVIQIANAWSMSELDSLAASGQVPHPLAA